MSNLILVVDDDPMVHKLLEYTLNSDEEFTSDKCLSAEEAQEYLADHKEVLAIILDWEMPGMNGLEMLAWLKTQERYKDIPVIMLTGRDKREEIKMGIDAGAYYYVTKPFNKDFLLSVLRAAVSEYLNIKQLAEQVQEARNPFANMTKGSFQVRTIDEGQKLSVLIANATPDPQTNLIICELLNNAIEHGNLAISYDEKSDLIDRNKLHEEMERRLLMPEYKDRYATIDIEIHYDHLLVTVEDMGDGFDYKKYLTFDENRVFDNHGRGIAMANTMLDINYIGKGNIVQVNIPLHTMVEAEA